MLFGFAVLVLLVFNAVPAAIVPIIPIGSIKINMYEVMILMLTFLCGMNVLKKQISIKYLIGPFFYPLIYLILSVGYGLFAGALIFKNEFAFTDARVHVNWLVLLLVPCIIKTNSDLIFIVKTMVVAAVFISIFIVIQSVFNINIMGGRVESLDGGINSSVIRSTAGGGGYLIIFSIILVSFFASNGLINKVVALLVLLILVLGLMFTFGRGLWGAAILALVFSNVLYGGVKRGAFTVFFGIILVSVIITVGSLLNADFFNAVGDRFFGVGTEISEGGSFGYREVENDYALDAISTSPLLGIGFGGNYKPMVLTVSNIEADMIFEAESRYIHNSFLYFPLKSGILAIFVPFVFISVFFVICFRSVNKFYGLEKILLASFFGGFISILTTSYTQPEWGASQGIFALSLFMQIAVCLIRIQSKTKT
jgi:hypothetical protein